MGRRIRGGAGGEGEGEAPPRHQGGSEEGADRGRPHGSRAEERGPHGTKEAGEEVDRNGDPTATTKVVGVCGWRATPWGSPANGRRGDQQGAAAARKWLEGPQSYFLKG